MSAPAPSDQTTFELADLDTNHAHCLYSRPLDQTFLIVPLTPGGIKDAAQEFAYALQSLEPRSSAGFRVAAEFLLQVEDVLFAFRKEMDEEIQEYLEEIERTEDQATPTQDDADDIFGDGEWAGFFGAGALY